ncbi:hypothetical protein HLB23_03945 [Nocardia uniformis]|uniref:Uncharacterized protein n=1 Tax=Nocardia uniformis TaxID=53432 RepID=A0A849C7T8_9NOCA|nr:hypothetical protein [Nocardia uniformis]NNH69031.1 hypothetical protein [Nocardia uniformis]
MLINSVNPEPPPADDLVLMPWKPGPRHDISGPVFVAVTDFLAGSDADVQRIFELGLELERTWPVMHGAVGLWLWGKPSQLRGGSISVWETEADMRRFVRWPVHAEIMRAWVRRVGVVSDSWHAARFDSAAVLTQARRTIDRPHRDAA